MNKVKKGLLISGLLAACLTFLLSTGAAGSIAGIVKVQDAGGKPVAVKSYEATLSYEESALPAVVTVTEAQTEILRPNATGDSDENNPVPGTGEENYEDVDEESEDGGTTQVWSTNANYLLDLYNIADHSAGSRGINFIKVYGVAWYTCPGGDADRVSFKLAIKSGTGANPPDTTSYGDEETLPKLVGNRQTFSYQWYTNPATGSAWTWDEIDNLQIGVALRDPVTAGGGFSRCTQVYVEVEYTEAEPQPPDIPTLISPPDGATDVSVTPDLIFGYSDPDNDDCTKFDLKVDDNSDFSSPEIDETDYSTGGPWSSGGTITYSVSTPLSYDTQYYWKVRVFDGTAWSDWSDGSWDFTTTISEPEPQSEILRPNATGDSDENNPVPGTGEENYEDVDEESEDGGTTQVWSTNDNYLLDLYNIADHSVGSGGINFIKVYGVAWYTCKTGDADRVSFKLAIKSGTGANPPDTTSYGDEETLPKLVGNRQTFSYQWYTNPATGSAWTWDEIDNLQIGVALRDPVTAGGGFSRCTQVYVEVEYEE